MIKLNKLFFSSCAIVLMYCLPKSTKNKLFKKVQTFTLPIFDLYKTGTMFDAFDPSKLKQEIKTNQSLVPFQNVPYGAKFGLKHALKVYTIAMSVLLIQRIFSLRSSNDCNPDYRISRLSELVIVPIVEELENWMVYQGIKAVQNVLNTTFPKSLKNFPMISSPSAQVLGITAMSAYRQFRTYPIRYALPRMALIVAFPKSGILHTITQGPAAPIAAHFITNLICGKIVRDAFST